MTVREALKKFGFDTIFEEIVSIYPKEASKKSQYKKAYNELIKITGKVDKKIKCIKVHGDYDESGYFYLTVRLKNKYYVPPPSGFKPYGGESNDEGDVPQGEYYNINCDRYSKYFAIGPFWEQYVDLKLSSTYSDLIAISGFLYELTFHGFSQKECQDFFKDILDIWHTHK